MPRMRKKKNMDRRLEACRPVFFDEPELNRGRWREVCGFDKCTQLMLELGCGKGKFVVGQAKRYPDRLFVAFEKEPTVILLAMENAIRNNCDNIFFVCADIASLSEYFETDETDIIFINFCDPWTRQNKPKRRLTHRSCLEVYKSILKNNGELFFKTDSEMLFDFSLEELDLSGFQVLELTRDLHHSAFNETNISTEFEEKYASENIPIKWLHASSQKD
ncbi:MAG: tRNA (guanosine(46)-N7)-methyltransferase TrmB [Clostridiaceae bacterium]|nr:tRNA (guanosine(46)-N7)-methyltransferase TrmB [Clostridiaceae bacterium]